MTPHDIKRTLIFFRETELNLKKENFIILFGGIEGEMLWNQYRNFDYSLSLFFTCIPSEQQDKLSKHISKLYNENHAH